MKTIKYRTIAKSLFLSVGLVTLAGCNDYLDITPPSAVVSDTYLWDAAQLGTYVINYYGGTDNSTPYGTKNDEMGGMFPSHTGGNGESAYNNDNGTDNEMTTGNNNSRYAPGKGGWTVGQKDGSWNFKNIRALNYYLETVLPRYYAGQIKGSASEVKHYIGEGYFLRAQEYFYRLRRLGDFPIITKTYNDGQVDSLKAISARRPRNEVARFILNDLDSAIVLLGSISKNRISRDAALLLKARVALYEGSFEKFHAGTALVPGTDKWPGKDKAYNRDFAFKSGSAEKEVEFFLNEAMKASKEVADAYALVDNNKVIRASETQAKNPYYDMFATVDPSSYKEAIMYRSYSEELTMGHWFNHYAYAGAAKGFTKQFEKTFLMENGLPWYAVGSNYTGDDLIESTKVGRDWRWQLFMKAPNEVMAFENVKGNPGKFANAPVVYQSDKASTSTGYIRGKGYSLDMKMSDGGKDYTAFIVYRAAEAYLIYIEASYLYNKTIDADEDAKKYWKALRKRAGVSEDYNATIAATDMSQEAVNDWGAYSHNQLVDATLYNIRRERRCEFINEGMRYDDLVRWRAMDQLEANNAHLEGCKIWSATMQKRYKKGVLVADNSVEAKNNVSSKSLSNYLRPNEIKMTGNPYYKGLSFCEAHYLDPIAIQNFLNTSPDNQTIEDSPIYQNPGWPTIVGASPIGY